MSASDPRIERNPTLAHRLATAHFLDTSARFLGLPLHPSGAIGDLASVVRSRPAGRATGQQHELRDNP